MNLAGVALLIFLVVLMLLLGAWVLIPMLYGSPWVPSFQRRIRRAMELAQVRPGETVFDLGSGDGRVLICAARDFKARAVGYEIEPVHCLVSWLRARALGLQSSIRVHCQDFTRADLSSADVVFLYLTAGHVPRITSQIESQLRRGARVVSVSNELPGWKPAAVDREHLLFLYRMPPVQGDLLTFLAEDQERRELSAFSGADGQPGGHAAE